MFDTDFLAVVNKIIATKPDAAFLALVADSPRTLLFKRVSRESIPR